MRLHEVNHTHCLYCTPNSLAAWICCSLLLCATPFLTFLLVIIQTNKLSSKLPNQNSTQISSWSSELYFVHGSRMKLLCSYIFVHNFFQPGFLCNNWELLSWNPPTHSLFFKSHCWWSNSGKSFQYLLQLFMRIWSHLTT